MSNNGICEDLGFEEGWLPSSQLDLLLQFCSQKSRPPTLFLRPAEEIQLLSQTGLRTGIMADKCVAYSAANPPSSLLTEACVSGNMLGEGSPF